MGVFLKSGVLGGRTPSGVGVAVDTAKAWPQSEHSSAKGRGHVSVRSRLSSG